MEGSYIKLKSYLQVLTGDFKLIYQKLTLFWTSQYCQYIQDLTQCHIRFSHSLLQLIYEQVINLITLFTLNKVDKQLLLLHQQLQLNKWVRKLCTGLFWSFWGLPCQHDFINVAYIDPVSIHPHWHFNCLMKDAQQYLRLILLNPILNWTQGRPAGTISFSIIEVPTSFTNT